MQQLPLLGMADTRLDPQAALILAQQVLAEPRGLMTTFNMSTVQAQAGQLHPTGFSYRSYVTSLGMRLRMNDGYVVAQDNGQGGTRVSFHENKRYAIILGACIAAYLVIVLLIYFLAFGSSTPTVTPQPGGFGQPTPMAPMAPAASTGGSGLWVLIPGILITLLALGQLYDILTIPKKAVERFNQLAMYGAGGGQPGFPGQPQPFPGQPQPGFPGQPQGGFPPPQPQPQPGFAPPQPQGGFPPAQPGGGFPQPQAGFPPQQQPQGGFPPRIDIAKPQPSPVNTDIDNKLRELAQLRDGGIISPADFDQAKASLEAKRVG